MKNASSVAKLIGRAVEMVDDDRGKTISGYVIGADRRRLTVEWKDRKRTSLPINYARLMFT